MAPDPAPASEGGIGDAVSPGAAGAGGAWGGGEQTAPQRAARPAPAQDAAEGAAREAAPEPTRAPPPEPPSTTPRGPGLFDGPATRERNLFVAACLGSLIVMPLVGIASLFWWPAAANYPGQTAYRRRWLVASVLLGAFDVLLFATLTARSAFEDSFPLPWAAAGAQAQALLGVSCREDEGRLLVESVLPDTAAADAGLADGDEISALDGKPVRSTAALQKVVALHGAGEIDIAYLRDGEARTARARMRGEPDYLRWHREGSEALRRGDLRRARFDFERSLADCRSSPAAAGPLEGLALVSLREGNTESAGSFLEEALKVSTPSGRDPLLSLRAGVALKKGEAREAERWLGEIEDPDLRRALALGALALEGRAGEAWRRGIANLLASRAWWLPLGVLALLAIIAGFRRPPREALRFFFWSAGALMGAMLFSHIAAGIYGAWAHGNPFAHHLPPLFPVDFILAQLWPFALLALSIRACRSVLPAGGLPLGLGARGASGLAGDVISGLMLLLGFCWRAKMAVWAAGFPDAREHPLQEMAGLDLRFLWWLLPLICVVGPAAEEFYFRGLLQGRLRLRVGPVTAIALTAFFFGLVHPVSPGYVAAAAAIGAVLGYLRERSGTLIVPILTHALWNTAVWGLIYLR